MGKSPSPDLGTWSGSRNLGEPPGPRLPCCLCIVVTQQGLGHRLPSDKCQVSGQVHGGRRQVGSSPRGSEGSRPGPTGLLGGHCRGKAALHSASQLLLPGLASVPPVLPRTWVALPMPEGADVEGFLSPGFGQFRSEVKIPVIAILCLTHPPAWPDGLTLPLLTPASLPP